MAYIICIPVNKSINCTNKQLLPTNCNNNTIWIPYGHNTSNIQHTYILTNISSTTQSIHSLQLYNKSTQCIIHSNMPSPVHIRYMKQHTAMSRGISESFHLTIHTTQLNGHHIPDYCLLLQCQQPSSPHKQYYSIDIVVYPYVDFLSQLNKHVSLTSYLNQPVRHTYEVYNPLSCTFEYALVKLNGDIDDDIMIIDNTTDRCVKQLHGTLNGNTSTFITIQFQPSRYITNVAQLQFECSVLHSSPIGLTVSGNTMKLIDQVDCNTSIHSHNKAQVRSPRRIVPFTPTHNIIVNRSSDSMRLTQHRINQLLMKNTR